MLNFSDFRESVLTDERVKEIIEEAKQLANKMKTQEDWMATFSANFSLFVLAEYHKWVSRSE